MINYFKRTLIIFTITLLITSLIHGSLNFRHLSRAYETYGVKAIVSALFYHKR